MNYLLSEAHEPIKQALERLLEKDEERSPFVSVSQVGRYSIFARFDLKNDGILFNLPALRISFEEVTPETGAMRAVEELMALGMKGDGRVLIREEEEDPSWKGDVPLKRPRPA